MRTESFKRAEESLQKLLSEIIKIQNFVGDDDERLWMQLDEFEFESIENVFSLIKEIKNTRLYKSR